MTKLETAIVHILNKHPEFTQEQITSAIFFADLINYNITGELMFPSKSDD